MVEIKRDKYLQDLIDRMHNGMIKVVTGIRRCGKTYLLFELFKRHLLESGVQPEHIIEVALDVEGSERLRDSHELSLHLRSKVDDPKAQYYILIDEVQYAISDKELRGTEPPRIYGVLNGLLRMRNVDVYVTGSNSKLLSTGVMTEFRGRGDEVRVKPLSFSEFMQSFDGDVYRGWAEYSAFGGMPLTLSMKSDEQKARYLENLFVETYLKDIVARNRVSHERELGDLVNVVASSIGSLTSPSKIAATFKSVMGSSISDHTVNAYLGYMEDAFLVEEAKRYDVKGRKHIGSPKKYYFEDVGLRNARLGFSQVEPTHLMENIVFNELRMRGFSVDVGVIEKRGRRDGHEYRSRLEVDFVANLGNRRYYIQSAYAIPDDDKRRQEKESLLRIGDSFKKIVVVKDVVKTTRDTDGIVTMGLYDFLLDPSSLDA